MSLPQRQWQVRASSLAAKSGWRAAKSMASTCALSLGQLLKPSCLAICHWACDKVAAGSWLFRRGKSSLARLRCCSRLRRPSVVEAEGCCDIRSPCTDLFRLKVGSRRNEVKRDCLGRSPFRGRWRRERQAVNIRHCGGGLQRGFAHRAVWGEPRARLGPTVARVLAFTKCLTGS